MSKRYAVIRTDGNTGQKTQVGGAVKTPDKAADLKARMRAQQPLGGSNSFSIERVR